MALTVATQSQADRLRADTNTTTTSLPDASIDDIWTEAGETYSGVSLTAYTRVIVFRRILAGVIPLNDYRQNESEEKAGQMFAKVEKALKFWQDELAAAVVLGAGSAARFGRTAGIPARVKEYPGL